jgi:hypothetical protein
MLYYLGNTHQKREDISMTGAITAGARRLLTGAGLALGAFALSGCLNISTSFSGVPLDELDTGGAAPVEFALAGPDDAILTVGDTLAITVEGDAAAREAVLFRLDGDKLAVGRDGDWDSADGKATIRVTMPAPREVSLAGSGDISAETLAKSAEVSIAGSGKVTIADLDADRLEVSSAGSGTLAAKGRAERLEISIAGSGDIDFAEVMADDVEISIAGSGDIRLASDGRVSSSIVGSGNVYVTGSATCKTSAVGSGEVTCKPAAQAASTAPDSATPGEPDETAARE